MATLAVWAQKSLAAFSKQRFHLHSPGYLGAKSPHAVCILRCFACAMRFGTISAAALPCLPPHRPGRALGPGRCLFSTLLGHLPHRMPAPYRLLLSPAPALPQRQYPWRKTKASQTKAAGQAPLCPLAFANRRPIFALHCQYANSKTKPPGRLKATAVFCLYIRLFVFRPALRFCTQFAR